MNPSNERFFHFDTCLDRLRSVWKTLLAVKEAPSHPLAIPAFRFALVEYVTPHTTSVGKHARYKLDDRYISPNYLPLHTRLVASRHQVHAHSDLVVLDPSLMFVDLYDQRLVATIQKGMLELKELENLDEILLLVEATIDSMSADRDRLASLLEP